jgi:hypothetical protein
VDAIYVAVGSDPLRRRPELFFHYLKMLPPSFPPPPAPPIYVIGVKPVIATVAYKGSAVPSNGI